MIRRGKGLGLLAAMMAMTSTGHSVPMNDNGPVSFDPLRKYKAGPGTNQRKRRKMARQTPASKYNK